jgi:hypothetical protein
MPGYKIELIKTGELKEYPRLVETIERELPELNEEELSKVVSIVIDTCHSCYNASSICQCWNDE